MATQCLAWKIDDRRMDSFEGGPKFHLPLRCDQLRVSGELICAKCLGRREKPRKREGTYPQKWWGLLTEPIDNIGPQVNKMVYSPWFLEKAKKYSLSQESMVRAKKMYEAAVAGVEAVPPVPDLVAVAAATEAEIPASQEAPKKAGRKKKQEAAPAPAPVSTKEKKKPGPKPKTAEPKPKASAEAKPVAKPAESLPPVTAIVENAEPVASEDTVFIKVRHFEHADRSYLYDSTKHKLYDKKTFKYIGRWDSEVERIVHDVPDSDAE